MSQTQTPTDDPTEPAIDSEPWEGPIAEFDKHDQPTGAAFYRCRSCGVEIHTDADRSAVEHRDTCRYSGVSA